MNHFQKLPRIQTLNAVQKMAVAGKCAGAVYKCYATLVMKPVYLFLLLLVSYHASAEIYKWTDKDGKVHFSDSPKERSANNIEKVGVKVNTYTHVSVEWAPVKTDSVVMYATAWCGYCKKARKYFKKHNILFTEYDIEKSKAAHRRYKKMGGKGVPIILYKGKRMNGFSEEKYKSIYKPSA